MRAALAAARPEVVYHLGSPATRPGQKPRAALADDLLATANVLAATHAEGCRILVHAGSGGECGPHTGPVPEGAPVDPRTEYTLAKAMATLLCLVDSHQGRPVVVVRVFAAYGPWEGAHRLVPYLMDCCLRGAAPRVSAGWQRRDFIHAADVTALLRRAAALPPTPGLVLHAGCGREHTVRDMVDTVLAVCGSRAAPVYGAEALRPGEPERYLAAVEQTQARTGWAPRFDLRAGVEHTWDWFRQHAGRRAA